MLKLKLILLSLILFLGCQSRDVAPKVSGLEYFPLRTGTYWVYTVTETQISQLGGQTNLFYELKVQVADSVFSAGQVTYLLKRFTRSSETQPWVSLDTWSSQRSQFQAVVQEGNIPFIKMSFPLAEGKTWNGNALNNVGGEDKCENGSFACDNYMVTDFMKPFESSVRYEDSVTILESNDNDPIVKSDIRKSVYAKSIGLIYREVNILEYCTVGTCIGKQIVENGTIFKQTIKEYVGG